jgi:Zn-finger in Ran binding protein and others
VCQCGFDNFAFRGTCRSCGTNKPEGGDSSSAPMEVAASGDSMMGGGGTGGTGGGGGGGGGPAPRPGDWSCDCGFNNFAFRIVCNSCRAPRPSSLPPATGPGFGTSVQAKPGDWVCDCGFHNFAFRNSCNSCSKARPAGTGGDLDVKDGAHLSTGSGAPVGGGFGGFGGGGGGGFTKPGDWVCSCGFNNFAFRTFCNSCNSPKPSGGGPPMGSGGGYGGGGYGGGGYGGGGYGGGGGGYGGGGGGYGGGGGGGGRPGDWQCACGYSNFGFRATCNSCNAAKEGGSPAPGGGGGYGGGGGGYGGGGGGYGGGYVSRPGDWVCSCGFNNFASRRDCNSCGMPKMS